MQPALLEELQTQQYLFMKNKDEKEFFSRDLFLLKDWLILSREEREYVNHLKPQLRMAG